MNQFLKANGLRESTSDVVKPKEFHKVSESVEVDEDCSTMGAPAYMNVIEYDVAFALKTDAVAFVKSILTNLRDEAGFTTGAADITKADSGWTVTLIFNKKVL